jgi:hypothetical protein
MVVFLAFEGLIPEVRVLVLEWTAFCFGTETLIKVNGATAH